MRKKNWENVNQIIKKERKKGEERKKERDKLIKWERKKKWENFN